MCRAKSDPRGGYQCRWRTGKNFFTNVTAAALDGPAAHLRAHEALIRAGGAGLAASVGSPSIDATWDAVLSATIKDIGTSVDEVFSGNPNAEADLQTALSSGGALLSMTHLVCGAASLVGSVCATMPSATGQLADAVGHAVAQQTNQVAGAVARAITKRIIENLTSTAGIPDPAQVGFVADSVAVVMCPDRNAHDEVVESDKRLAGKLAEAGMVRLISDLAADRAPGDA